MNRNQLRIPKTLQFAQEITEMNNNFSSINSYGNNNNLNLGSPTNNNNSMTVNSSRSVNKFIKSNSKFTQENNETAKIHRNEDLGNNKKIKNLKCSGNGNGNAYLKNGNSNGNGNGTSSSFNNGNHRVSGSAGSMIYDILDLYMLPESAEQQKPNPKPKHQHQHQHQHKYKHKQKQKFTITNSTSTTCTTRTKKNLDPLSKIPPVRITSKNNSINDENSQTVLMASLHKGYHQYFNNDDDKRIINRNLTDPTKKDLLIGYSKFETSIFNDKVTIEINDENKEQEQQQQNKEREGDIENEGIAVSGGGGPSSCDLIGTIVDGYNTTNDDEVEDDKESLVKNHGFWWRTTTCMVNKFRIFGHHNKSISTTTNDDNNVASISKIEEDNVSRGKKELIDEKLKSLFSDETIEEKNLQNDEFIKHEQLLPKRRVTIQDQAEIIYPSNDTSELNYYTQPLNYTGRHRHHHRYHYHRHNRSLPSLSSSTTISSRKVSRKFSFFKKGGF